MALQCPLQRLRFVVHKDGLNAAGGVIGLNLVDQSLSYKRRQDTSLEIVQCHVMIVRQRFHSGDDSVMGI